MPDFVAKTVYYSGRVQGVGFRFTTKQIAEGYEVTGWVRNLSDGRVEMLAAAEDVTELDDFLTAVEEGPMGANIREVAVKDSPDAAKDPPKGFRITH